MAADYSLNGLFSLAAMRDCSLNIGTGARSPRSASSSTLSHDTDDDDDDEAAAALVASEATCKFC
jgi:hypothetical protein